MSQHQNKSPRKPRGRPPSKEARRKALAAAYAILMGEGFGRLTMDAVAAKSGVGKPTIYRNWSNASELAMAALMSGSEDEELTGVCSLLAALEIQLHRLVAAFATTRGRQITLALAASDPESEMTKAFRNRVILSSREGGRRLIDAAVATGEIPPPENMEVLLDMIYAPLFYRLLVKHQPLDKAFSDQMVSEVTKLLSAQRNERQTS